jgi:tRNA dimethylallyltransferase
LNATLRTSIIAIVGPTAVGKTAVAIELSRLIGGEIISADSMAVYRGMDVGTAKPTPEEQAKAKFHLIDVADPSAPFSVGEFQRLAHKAIDAVIERNPPAIVVGGSGLYVRAAVDGLDTTIPPADPDLRRRLLNEATTHGVEWVHSRLAEIDPESAERIHPANLKRVVRAIEIYERTGIPASVFFEKDSRRKPRYSDARFFGLIADRAELYARIDRRVDAMVDSGLVEEATWLLETVKNSSLPSMQGLGYKEIAGYIRGDYGLNEAVELIKKNTRRFAKRQLTWFRADARVTWIDVTHRTAVEVSLSIKETLNL